MENISTGWKNKIRKRGFSYWEDLLADYSEVAVIPPLSQGEDTKEQVGEGGL